MIYLTDFTREESYVSEINIGFLKKSLEENEKDKNFITSKKFNNAEKQTLVSFFEKKKELQKINLNIRKIIDELEYIKCSSLVLIDGIECESDAEFDEVLHKEIDNFNLDYRGVLNNIYSLLEMMKKLYTKYKKVLKQKLSPSEYIKQHDLIDNSFWLSQELRNILVHESILFNMYHVEIQKTLKNPFFYVKSELVLKSFKEKEMKRIKKNGGAEFKNMLLEEMSKDKLILHQADVFQLTQNYFYQVYSIFEFIVEFLKSSIGKHINEVEKFNVDNADNEYTLFVLNFDENRADIAVIHSYRECQLAKNLIRDLTLAEKDIGKMEVLEVGVYCLEKYKGFLQ